MSVKAILTEQQKSYTKAEEDALLANYYNKDYIDTYMAPLDTPTFVGVPKAPTAAVGTNTTQIATTAFVQTANQTRVPKYGKGVNLLRNWYFVGGGTGRGVFPVNQRGQSSYSGPYSIDGWHGVTASQMTLASGYITTASTTYWQDVSPEILKSLLGKSVTASALLADGTLVTGTAVYQTSYSGNNVYNYGTQGILKYGVTNSGAGYQSLRLEPGSYVAVKVELGTEQTLCHNEGTAANPVWVLNDVPDYEYELYRCMTSTADSTDTYANKSLATEQEIAYVENGTTASRAYAAREYFCWNGLLYRAKTAISSGSSFTVGTNCEMVSDGGLNRVRDQIIVNRQSLASSISSGLNTLTATPTSKPGYVAGGIVGIQFPGADRTKISLVESLIDASTGNITVQFNSTFTSSTASVAAFVLYIKL